jgi:hypothetical protein
MSLTISSAGGGNLDWVDNVATYHASAHGFGGLIFIDYTKGDEDGMEVAIECRSKGMGLTTYYQYVSVNSSTRILSALAYIIQATGKYRIPVTWTTEEDELRFTITQYGNITATGTVTLDFREAN